MRNRHLKNSSKEKNFKNCCSGLLKESSLTGVSSIVSSRGWFRKLIKMLILCLAVAGFLLQTFEFLELYWQYSTTTLEKGMSKMKKPAITICDENLMRRRFLCETFSESCFTLESSSVEVDCKITEDYCLDPNDIYLFEYPFLWDVTAPAIYYNISFTRLSGFEIEKNLLQCEWISNETQISSKSTPCGKPEFVRGINKEKHPGACYTLKSSVHMLEEDLERDTMLRMTLRWYTSDLLKSILFFMSGGRTPRYYWIAFHFPGQAANPFMEGIRIKEGNIYDIKLSQVDTVRLPPPYSSKCFDYVNEWKKNHFEGPLGREDCQVTCEINATFEAFGCVTRAIAYPHDKELCLEHKSYDYDLNVKIQKCKESCRDACKDTHYVADVKVEDYIDIAAALKEYGAANVAILDVSFDVSKSVTIEHEPIYESVELISYIGGYLGMWLGWSLLAVFDFVEIILNLCMYPFTRKKKTK